ncbi:MULTISPECIES: restriction endonuclease subunit S [Bacteroidales]|uniref:restriction endonuclease subunit S n=1 Tax=Bacteroidales TaxID=171549 RepID=UPI0004D95EE4|nr:MULTISPECIES: restriction endonuclease subunit S [Bacteroidales]KDS43796.1 type I restriction modification DNA specificity domain protein [Parabacteroides distasonis str. 3776 Po2 i]MCE8633308.1 restriction endonuclease subunit S [Bacteroides fragilis]MCE8682883.1 restriction endonuclease subunit S [Bacteroides fragilis]MDK2386322.1 restriction endonuclease subunit S [Bacteroides fragilis]RGN99332.1 restriction endonuclease subunit S [Bacteroides fragilis]
MDTKKLRQKILDLAIRGKLVPQDPNDEPASVLLERIKAEKERLIKEGKIKRSKKSAKTSDTPHYGNVPFEIPSSWVWCKLENITVLIEDCPHTTAKDEGEGYPLVRTPNIGEGQLLLDGVHRVSKEVYDKRNIRAVPQVNDIIYAREAPAGNAAVIRENEQVCLGQRTVLIRPMDTLIDSVWLTYAILAPYSRNHLTSKATGSTVSHVNMASIRPFDLPLPPISEQHRIVAEIRRWFALIDQIEQGKSDLQATIKQTKNKILDLAIHGKLVPQDPNDEPAIELLKRINLDFTPCDNGHSRKLPQGWYSVTVNEVCSIIGGVSYNKADIQDTGIRVLRGGNIQGGKVIDCFDDVFIPLSYQNNDNQVQHGDIIVVASTGSQTLIGKTGFADRDIPKTQIGAFLRIVRSKQKTLSPYIRLIFQTDAYKDYIRNVAKGSNINNVKNAHLQNYQICLPPLEEQQRIVQKIEELFSFLDDIQTALEV